MQVNNMQWKAAWSYQILPISCLGIFGMELQIHFLITMKLLLETFYMNLSYKIYGKHLYKYTGSCSTLTIIHEGSTGMPPPSNGCIL